MHDYTVSVQSTHRLMQLAATCTTAFQAEVFPLSFSGNMTGNYLFAIATCNNNEIFPASSIGVSKESSMHQCPTRLLSVAFALGICSASDLNIFSEHTLWTGEAIIGIDNLDS